MKPPQCVACLSTAMAVLLSEGFHAGVEQLPSYRNAKTGTLRSPAACVQDGSPVYRYVNPWHRPEHEPVLQAASRGRWIGPELSKHSRMPPWPSSSARACWPD